MSKTAIQEMMSEIQANYPQLFDVYTQIGRSFVNDMHKYLAIEQQQHGQTWDNAITTFKCRGMVESRAICDFDEYYEATYGTNSN
jgi:hypothetical protein